MATFIHLADAKDSKKILRDGIRLTQTTDGKAVFCVPVVPSFQTTFQWLRELKRKGFRTACAVQFRIPDTEVVRVGRYGQQHSEMLASEAVKIFRAANDAMGLEVLVSRKIGPKEITRIRSIPQIQVGGFIRRPRENNRFGPLTAP